MRCDSQAVQRREVNEADQIGHVSSPHQDRRESGKLEKALYFHGSSGQHVRSRLWGHHRVAALVVLLSVGEVDELGIVLPDEIEGHIRDPRVTLLLQIPGKGVPPQDALRHANDWAVLLHPFARAEIERPLPLSCIDDRQAHADTLDTCSVNSLIACPHAGQRPSSQRDCRSISPPQPRLNRSRTMVPHLGQKVSTHSEPTKLWK